MRTEGGIENHGTDACGGEIERAGAFWSGGEKADEGEYGWSLQSYDGSGQDEYEPSLTKCHTTRNWATQGCL